MQRPACSNTSIPTDTRNPNCQGPHLGPLPSLVSTRSSYRGMTALLPQTTTALLRSSRVRVRSFLLLLLVFCRPTTWSSRRPLTVYTVRSFVLFTLSPSFPEGSVAAIYDPCWGASLLTFQSLGPIGYPPLSCFYCVTLLQSCCMCNILSSDSSLLSPIPGQLDPFLFSSSDIIATLIPSLPSTTVSV